MVWISESNEGWQQHTKETSGSIEESLPSGACHLRKRGKGTLCHATDKGTDGKGPMQTTGRVLRNASDGT